MINILKSIIIIIISFIIISIIILVSIYFINNNIETFAFDKTKINYKDDVEILTNISPNLLIYLKFNNNEIINGYHIKQHGTIGMNTISCFEKSLEDISIKPSIICSINTNDYVKGNGSLEFKGSTGLFQLMLNNTLTNNFTIAFLLNTVI